MIYNVRFQNLSIEQIGSTNPKLMDLLTEIDKFCGHNLWIHRLQDNEAGDTSQHQLGRAADGHIDRMSLLDQYVLLERFNPGGLGLYGPDVWNHPGFHFDIRPVGPPTAKWGCVKGGSKGTQYVALDRGFFKRLIALEEAKEG